MLNVPARHRADEADERSQEVLENAAQALRDKAAFASESGDYLDDTR